MKYRYHIVSESIKYFIDLQLPDGRAMLLKYVTRYVTLA